MEVRSKEVVRFVSALFRHGNRAPTVLEMKYLSKEGQSYNNFYPVGLGGLTNEGKRNMYKLGTNLRNRYKDFLSDTYIPEDVEARSTDFPRAKMSLNLLLAGLYPPSEAERWNQELAWQPIPSINVAVPQDNLLCPWAATPKWVDEYRRVGSLPEVVDKAKELRPLAKKLSNLAGKPVNDLMDLWVMYNGLTALKSMNCALPEWANDIFPSGTLHDACCLQYQVENWTNLLKRLNGGVVLKRMIDDMKTVVGSGNVGNTRKINLFSCHEVNVVGLLATLGLYDKPHVPEYSSAVIVELIQRDEAYYVKIIRYLGIPAKFEEQEISDFGTLCPFDRFVDLMKHVTASDEEYDSSRDGKFDLLPIADQLRVVKL